jgi:hypothetical protein
MRLPEQAHAGGGSQRFAFVLRMRPDLVVLCKLPRDPSPMFDDDHDGRKPHLHALISHDFAMLMRREALDAALTIYTHALDTFECRLKLELCVPARLIHAGFRVAQLYYGSAIVRSQAYVTTM